jgi:hypothetical protein
MMVKGRGGMMMGGSGAGSYNTAGNNSIRSSNSMSMPAGSRTAGQAKLDDIM